MQLTFLEAAVPLTKGYEKRPDGSYAGGAYPGVTNFTSHTEEVENPAQFAAALSKHAAEGHCLLTNSLEKAIVNESRRQLSDKHEPREWVLMDIDGLDGVDSVDEFIYKVLPPPFYDVSYVVQHSPSSGIKPGVRAHIYFLLYDKIDPRSIEGWLAEINLTNSVLSNQVTLSKSNLALHYPLDRVASRNGRIVYITPPECKNFADPVSERIHVVEKKHDKLSFAFSTLTPAEIARHVRDHVNTLRGQKGLKVSKKEEHIRISQDGLEILHDDLVEAGTVSSWMEDNERFMRCNINGGDSYAYYYYRDQDDPYIHNFKGEPSFRMRLFDPEFYRSHVMPHFDSLEQRRPRPFVFRDRLTDKWYAGLRQNEEIVEQPYVIGSDGKIDDYFSQYGASPPAVKQTWDRIFDPTFDHQWNEDDKVFNIWRPTEYQTNTMYASGVPDTIEKILRHVTGDDQETYDHFVNWLAYTFQNRTKTGTAWVMHGVPGTGKGLLFHHIITPIFGRDYCVSKQIKDLKDKFNGWMEQCLFVNIDEVNAEDAGREAREVVNALKNWITEPIMSIRHMQAAALMRESFINFIFTTNDFGVLPIQDGDRRFNVAPRQENKIEIEPEEVKKIKDELHSFSSYLASYKVDREKAHTALDNQAKSDLKMAARNSIEEFFQAVREGDLEFFVDGTHEHTDQYQSLADFKEAVDRWIADAKAGRASVVTRHELKAAHIVMCRDKPMKSTAFLKMAAKKGMPEKRYRGEENRLRGWKVDWELDESARRELKIHLTAVKTDEQKQAEIQVELGKDSN